MAENAPSGVSYYLLIDKTYQDHIAPLRKWTHLKVAFDKESIWITNFDTAQITSATVKSIPYSLTFYSKAGQLYLQHSLLPDRKEPNLLWTPIERAFPIKPQKFNHNYFGIDEKIEMAIVPEETPTEAEVLLTTMQELRSYVETAPAIRLKHIRWVVVNAEDALLFGRPFLPINGKAYWTRQNAVIPVGYNFELSLLTDLITEKANPNSNAWIVWNLDATYYRLEKDLLAPLTLSSVRKTLSELKKIEDATVNSSKILTSS